MAVESVELWGAIVTAIAGFGSSCALVGKAVAKHLAGTQKQNHSFVAAVVEDNKLARAEFRAELVEARKEIVVARATFTECMSEQTAHHVNAIKTLEAECSKQREEDRKMIARLAGIDTASWKPGAIDRRRKEHREETSGD